MRRVACMCLWLGCMGQGTVGCWRAVGPHLGSATAKVHAPAGKDMWHVYKMVNARCMHPAGEDMWHVYNLVRPGRQGHGDDLPQDHARQRRGERVGALWRIKLCIAVEAVDFDPEGAREPVLAAVLPLSESVQNMLCGGFHAGSPLADHPIPEVRITLCSPHGQTAAPSRCQRGPIQECDFSFAACQPLLHACLDMIDTQDIKMLETLCCAASGADCMQA